MKIVNLVFHPDLTKSKVNKSWMEELHRSGKLSDSRDMYMEYPDFQIDVGKEQKVLKENDRIILQFPLYWYSCTPLLKKWLDDVLTYGFAYGSKGNQLKGKDLQIITSVGGKAPFYSGFDIYPTMYELLRPFQLTANLSQMNYMIPLFMYEADSASLETIESFGKKFASTIDAPERSDGRRYLEATDQL